MCCVIAIPSPPPRVTPLESHESAAAAQPAQQQVEKGFNVVFISSPHPQVTPLE
jgi:hypothetical protein